MKSLATILAALLATAIAAPGSAAIILTSPSEFSGPTIFIGFEAFPNGEPVPYTSSSLTEQWRSLGVLISDSSPENGASAYSGLALSFPNTPPHTGTRAIANGPRSINGFVELQFVVPGTNTPGTVEEVGLWVQDDGDPATVQFFDINGIQIESLVTTSNDTFLGVRSAEGVSRIRISDPDVFMIDDLQFSSVPEPSNPIILAGFGAASVGMSIIRRGNK